jgi:hypothetical protein
VHTIDVTGLGNDDSLQRQRSSEEAQRLVPGRESLNAIASDTGGRFFKDTNDLGAVLGEMAEMTSRFYVLGYQQVPKEALPWSAGRPLAVEVYGYGVTEDGTVLDHFAQLVRVDPAQADPEGMVRGLSLFGTLSMPPGHYTVRLMVTERESGSVGVQFLDVTVPPHDPRHGFLLPPLVVEDPGTWLTMEMGHARSGRAAVPFQVDGEPFVPRATFQLKPGQVQKVVLIAYEPERRGDPAADIQIRSSLTDHDGRQVPAGFLRVQRVLRDDDGRRTYVLGYTPEVSQPGDYTLRVGLGEAGSRLESYTRLKLVGGS